MGLMISGLVLNYGHICCLLELLLCFVLVSLIVVAVLR